MDHEIALINGSDVREEGKETANVAI